MNRGEIIPQFHVLQFVFAEGEHPSLQSVSPEPPGDHCGVHDACVLFLFFCKTQKIRQLIHSSLRQFYDKEAGSFPFCRPCNGCDPAFGQISADIIYVGRHKPVRMRLIGSGLLHDRIDLRHICFHCPLYRKCDFRFLRYMFFSVSHNCLPSPFCTQSGFFLVHDRIDNLMQASPSRL